MKQLQSPLAMYRKATITLCVLLIVLLISLVSPLSVAASNQGTKNSDAADYNASSLNRQPTVNLLSANDNISSDSEDNPLDPTDGGIQIVGGEVPDNADNISETSGSSDLSRTNTVVIHLNVEDNILVAPVDKSPTAPNSEATALENQVNMPRLISSNPDESNALKTPDSPHNNEADHNLQTSYSVEVTTASEPKNLLSELLPIGIFAIFIFLLLYIPTNSRAQ